mmetsp:Transcript_49882/g.124027  ORF Transcript_49882/g.124027 Transcript_49882/m.124027 type:complete len:226 (-) Transcript_49882:39-716(-)
MFAHTAATKVRMRSMSVLSSTSFSVGSESIELTYVSTRTGAILWRISSHCGYVCSSRTQFHHSRSPAGVYRLPTQSCSHTAATGSPAALITPSLRSTTPVPPCKPTISPPSAHCGSGCIRPVYAVSDSMSARWRDEATNPSLAASSQRTHGAGASMRPRISCEWTETVSELVLSPKEPKGRPSHTSDRLSEHPPLPMSQCDSSLFSRSSPPPDEVITPADDEYVV